MENGRYEHFRQPFLKLTFSMCALFLANIKGPVGLYGSVQVSRGTSSQDGISNAAAYSMKFQAKNGRFAAVDPVRRELSQEEFTCADCAEHTP